MFRLRPSVPKLLAKERPVGLTSRKCEKLIQIISSKERRKRKAKKKIMQKVKEIKISFS